MAETHFAPFVPRRVGTAIGPQQQPTQPPVAEKISDHETQTNSAVLDLESSAPIEEPALREISHEWNDDMPQAACAIADREISQSDTAAQIRGEAISLAAVAVGRILRHAVAFDPRVIARFVDDAFAAAGSPDGAIAYVNPADFERLPPMTTVCKDDAGLPIGAVCIDTSDGSVQATLDQRAQRCVRAAAHA